MRSFLLREIENGGYKLDKMLERIKAAASSGAIDIVHDQPYLERRARENAKVGNEIDIEKTVLDLVARVKALEDRLAEGGETEGGESGTVTLKEPYDPYKWYYTGDGCSFNGKNYTCKDSPASHPCTWAPNVMPNRWELDAVQPE